MSAEKHAWGAGGALEDSGDEDGSIRHHRLKKAILLWFYATKCLYFMIFLWFLPHFLWKIYDFYYFYAIYFAIYNLKQPHFEFIC